MKLDLWSIRKLGKIPVARKLVISFFHLWFRDLRIVEIGRGPLKGFRWVCRKEHQFWMPLGSYERETAQWLIQTIKPGDIYFDIGANAGYFTLLGSYLVKDGKTIAFDPVPLNVETIKMQIKVNEIANVDVEFCALSDTDGKVEFVIETCNANSHLSSVSIVHAENRPSQKIVVDAIRLDKYVESKKIVPNVIKIDVEGAEVQVLQGGINTFKVHRPVTIVSTHSANLFEECKAFFEKLDYKVITLNNFEHELLCYPSK